MGRVLRDFFPVRGDRGADPGPGHRRGRRSRRSTPFGKSSRDGTSRSSDEAATERRRKARAHVSEYFSSERNMRRYADAWREAIDRRLSRFPSQASQSATNRRILRTSTPALLAASMIRVGSSAARARSSRMRSPPRPSRRLCPSARPAIRAEAVSGSRVDEENPASMPL